MTESTDRDEWTEKSTQVFLDHPDRSSDPAKAALAAVMHFATAARLEDGIDEYDAKPEVLETHVWHLMFGMTGLSDEKGLIRDQVFGPRVAGGPKLHKLAVGIQALCEAKAINYAELYAEVQEDRDTLDPVTPKV